LEKVELALSITFIILLIALAVVADSNGLGAEGTLALAAATAASGGAAILLHHVSADKP